MITRIVAWLIAALCVYGCYVFASTWRSPWAMPGAGISSVMPKLPDGCGVKKEPCK